MTLGTRLDGGTPEEDHVIMRTRHSGVTPEEAIDSYHTTRHGAPGSSQIDRVARRALEIRIPHPAG